MDDLVKLICEKIVVLEKDKYNQIIKLKLIQVLMTLLMMSFLMISLMIKINFFFFFFFFTTNVRMTEYMRTQLINTII